MSFDSQILCCLFHFFPYNGAFSVPFLDVSPLRYVLITNSSLWGKIYSILFFPTLRATVHFLPRKISSIHTLITMFLYFHPCLICHQHSFSIQSSPIEQPHLSTIFACLFWESLSNYFYLCFMVQGRSHIPRRWWSSRRRARSVPPREIRGVIALAWKISISLVGAFSTFHTDVLLMQCFISARSPVFGTLHPFPFPGAFLSIFSTKFLLLLSFETSWSREAVLADYPQSLLLYRGDRHILFINSGLSSFVFPELILDLAQENCSFLDFFLWVLLRSTLLTTIATSFEVWMIFQGILQVPTADFC